MKHLPLLVCLLSSSCFPPSSLPTLTPCTVNSCCELMKCLFPVHFNNKHQNTVTLLNFEDCQISPFAQMTYVPSNAVKPVLVSSEFNIFLMWKTLVPTLLVTQSVLWSMVLDRSGHTVKYQTKQQNTNVDRWQ